MGNDTLTPEERFAEFQQRLGKQCTSLGDLDWDSIKAFSESIPSVTERVNFLDLISHLPDNGVANGYVVNPARHHRNTQAILRPLSQERISLLSQHFDLQRIRRRAEQIPNHLEAVAYLRETLESYIDYHPTIRKGSYSPEELTFVKTIESKIQLRKDLHAASSQFSSMPTPGQDAAAHANQLYEQVKGLVNGLKPLDESSARLIVELADDAIKEFGNTNQEKKVELRQWKAQAELVLPPRTIEELRKRAEGSALERAYPRNRKVQNTLYIVIVLLIIASGLLWLKKTFFAESTPAKVEASPSPANNLSVTHEPKSIQETPSPPRVESTRNASPSIVERLEASPHLPISKISQKCLA